VTWASSDEAVATVDATGTIHPLAPGQVTVTATCEGKSGGRALTVTRPLIKPTLDSNGQAAEPGAPVAFPPTIFVSDLAGMHVQGAVVTFTVTAGGGTVENAQVVTNDDGFASCGRWTLGATLGPQEVVATVGGTSVPITAYAVRSSSDIRITRTFPTPNSFVGDSIGVTASITSTYQLASVTAAIESMSVSLAYGPQGSSWSGRLSVAGLASGSKYVVITATDVLGHVAERAVHVQLDRLPTISVTSPTASGSMATPRIQVAASCSDDSPTGCALLTVKATESGAPLLTGTSSISGTVDLSAFEGGVVELWFTAWDDSGRATYELRMVYVPSPALTVVETVAPGKIWDHAGTRTLYVDHAGATPVLRIRDSSTGTVQDLEATTALDNAESHGFLTAEGAIYELAQAGCFVIDWRGGSRVELGRVSSCDIPADATIRVAGPYAVYLGSSELLRRDLAAGTNTVITAAADALNRSYAVAASGDVFYSTADTRQLYRWHDGTAMALTSDDPATAWNLYPVADGGTVVYLKRRGASGPSAVAVNDGSGEVLLATAQAEVPDYDISNGWIAFTQEDATQAKQVWRRSPAGATEQVTFFGSSSIIEAIGPDGTIVLTAGGRRFRAVPGASPEDVGLAGEGTVILREGTFYVLYWGNVLKLSP
jgi:hypothetical protein